MSVVIITGASGFVGSYLVEYFASRGWEVRALARSRPSFENPNVHFFSYQLGEQPPDEAFVKADYVIHTAYQPQARGQGDALELNVTAAKQLLGASRKHKVKKNIFISSLSARTDAKSVYGQQKVAVEKLFTTKRDVCVRSGLIIGAGGLAERLTAFMKKTHAMPLIGGGKQPLQFIAIADAAQAFETILTSNTGGTLMLAHPQAYSYKSLYKEFAKSAGVRALFLPIPYIALEAGISVTQILHLPLGFTKDNILGLKQAEAFDTTKDLAAIGLKPMGLRAALAQRYKNASS